MKQLLLILLYSVLSWSSEIDSLLEHYQRESELSKKTKDESAGHLIVYTRDDLELMQIETLKDILKTIPFFRYLENRVAQPDILNIDPVLNSSKSVKIYLNNNELILPILGSGISLFGNIEMDFIDHVEIYEGFPSFEFGIEPATVVIRLYSKTAQRDSGSRVKLMGASHGSHKENVYTSGIADNLEYFMYFNHSSNNQNIYTLDNESVKRNYATDHFYGSLSSDNYKIELQALSSKHDAFVGEQPYAVPKDSQLKDNFFNLAYSAKFLDKSLLFNLSYIYTDGIYDATYSSALPLILGGFSQIKQEHNENVLTASLEKNFLIANHALSLGLQFRNKKFDFSDLKYNNVPIAYNQAYNQESIYSVFIKDSIELSANSSFGIFFMQQQYIRNKGMKNEAPEQFRLSYIYSVDKLLIKTFASRQEFVPEPYMTAQAYVGNPILSPEIYLSLTQEIDYEMSQLVWKFIYGYTKTEDFLIPDSSGVMQNANDNLKIYYAKAGVDYLFRKKDKIQLQVDYQRYMPFESRGILNHYNYLLRMVNSIERFDIFNELVINSGYENLKTGYDYSAGIAYKMTADLHFKLKGENILNAGLTRKYLYNVTSQREVEVPVIEQKFMLSMEYLF